MYIICTLVSLAGTLVIIAVQTNQQIVDLLLYYPDGGNPEFRSNVGLALVTQFRDE